MRIYPFRIPAAAYGPGTTYKSVVHPNMNEANELPTLAARCSATYAYGIGPGSGGDIAISVVGKAGDSYTDGTVLESGALLKDGVVPVPLGEIGPVDSLWFKIVNTCSGPVTVVLTALYSRERR